MKRLITLDPKGKQQLCEEFGTSANTVGNALRYDTDSYMARKIRERALELGGIEWEQKSGNNL